MVINMKGKFLKKKVRSLSTVVTTLILSMAMSIMSFAAEDTNDLKVDIGGIIVDVEQVAEENGITHMH